MAGLALVSLGLAGIASGSGSALFWASLTLLSVGSGLTFPTLSALVSLHAPEEEQGEVLGQFRALGSLARAIGPFAAAILYWQYGPSVPYWAGAGFLLLPLVLVVTVPRPPR